MTDPPADKPPSPSTSNPMPKPPAVVEFYKQRQHELAAATPTVTALGSKNTTVTYYPPPVGPPPVYNPANKENVAAAADDADAYSDSMPDLVPADDTAMRNSDGAGSGWNENDMNTWAYTSTKHKDWTAHDGDVDMGAAFHELYDDGQNTDQLQDEWWDPHARARWPRPGPGLLPPAAWNAMHDTDHALATVTVTPPTADDLVAAVGTSTAQIPPDFAMPAPEDVRTAVPHPNAYYCRAENGWVLLETKRSTVMPALRHLPKDARLPDNDRRTKAASPCSGPEPHHFHRYTDAGDGEALTTPYAQREWEPKLSDRMTAFVCCNCSLYTLVSSCIIPGVVPGTWLDQFAQERANFPTPGRTGEDMVVQGFLAILRCVPRSPIARRV